MGTFSYISHIQWKFVYLIRTALTHIVWVCVWRSFTKFKAYFARNGCVVCSILWQACEWMDAIMCVCVYVSFWSYVVITWFFSKCAYLWGGSCDSATSWHVMYTNWANETKRIKATICSRWLNRATHGFDNVDAF